MKQKEILLELALDNLSILAELELSPNITLGIVDDRKIIATAEDFSGNVDWLPFERMNEIVDIFKESIHSVLHYLQDLSKNPSTIWSEPKLRKGLESTMVLVGEAASRLDSYLSLFKENSLEMVENSPEFQTVKKFYLEEIATHFEGGTVGATWKKEKKPKRKTLDIEEMGEFSSVQLDKEYELFYMRDEEEQPFFSPALLKNLKLFCDFNETADKSFLDDPLLRIHYIQDRDACGAADQMFQALLPYLKEFYEKKYPFDTHKFPALISKACMALMLAANPKNLIQNTSGKNALRYFADFQIFLQTLLTCEEYQKMMAYKKEEDADLLDLAHRLCYVFFMRKVGNRQEMIGFIHRLVHMGEEKRKSPSSLWTRFLVEDSYIRKTLERYPSGPLFKDLDIIRSGSDIVGFCPIRQGNRPHPLYSLGSKNRIDVLRIPSPTYQEKISKAVIIEEFQGFLHFYEEHKKKHLLINLQDKTNWKEYARAHLVESLSKQADYERAFHVITLAKNTSFYHQSEEYEALTSAKDFIHQLREQFSRPEECGFFFPKDFELPPFFDSWLEELSDFFFEDTVDLSRQSRMDFIEIFYGFLILKCMETYRPDSISFSCKDALDTGAVDSGFFYAFIKEITGVELSRDDEDALRFLFYAPALLVRERAVDVERLSRALSSLSLLEEKCKKKGSAMKKLLETWLHKDFIRLLQIS